MNNFISFDNDSEHRAVTLTPENNEVVHEAKLVYYQPNLIMPMHSHAIGQLSSVLMGKSEEVNLKGAQHNKYGSAEFKPIGYRHSNVIGPDGALFLSINLNPLHEHFTSEYGELKWTLSDYALAKEYWSALTSVLVGGNQTADIEGLVFAILNISTKYDGSVKLAPNWLKIAEQALNETDMGVSEIATYVGVHRVHLHRVFQAHFGLSVSQYKQKIKLQKGLASLVSHEQSIASASMSSGFSDQSHFSRVLKRHLGTTPSRLNTLLNGKAG